MTQDERHPDPESLVGGPVSRALAYVVLGATAGALGTVLMALSGGTEGHGHGGGGTSFAMLPHQALLAVPLVIVFAIFLHETTKREMATALLWSILGIALVDLALW